jgi:nucleoid DNA-binding protein
MANSRVGRDLVVSRVQKVLNLSTKKKAEEIVNKVITCIEDTLIDNLDINNFSMKLNSFGKFTVKHRLGTLRRIPFTGETKITDNKRKIRFIALGPLRRLEKKEPSSKN